jgi:DNA/RNA endonuclease YhcR with UshA esterase domain
MFIMKRELIKNISITIAIIGLIILIYFSMYQKQEMLEIKSLDYNYLNKKVILNGSIKKIRDYDNIRVIDFQDKTGSIEVLIDKKMNLKANQTLVISGKIEEYKGNLEIRLNRIIR